MQFLIFLEVVWYLGMRPVQSELEECVCVVCVVLPAGALQASAIDSLHTLSEMRNAKLLITHLQSIQAMLGVKRRLL